MYTLNVEVSCLSLWHTLRFEFSVEAYQLGRFACRAFVPLPLAHGELHH